MAQLDPGYDDRLHGISSLETEDRMAPLTPAQGSLLQTLQSAVPSNVDAKTFNRKKLQVVVNADPSCIEIILDGVLSETFSRDGNPLRAIIEADREQLFGRSGCLVYTIGNISVGHFR